MKTRSNYTIVVQFEDSTPKFINRNARRIMNWNGIYQRSLETKDFIFFANFQESDPNGSVMMYRKKDMSLASDNYFGWNYLFELMIERTEEFTYLSKRAKYEIKLQLEEFKKCG